MFKNEIIRDIGHPVRVGAALEVVIRLPTIQPNDLHVGRYSAGNIRLRIVSHEQALVIGNTEKGGSMVKDASIGLMDTN